jgi:hypothetical protein
MHAAFVAPGPYSTSHEVSSALHTVLWLSQLGINFGHYPRVCAQGARWCALDGYGVKTKPMHQMACVVRGAVFLHALRICPFQVKIGVAEHTMLQTQLKNKNNMPSERRADDSDDEI